MVPSDLGRATCGSPVSLLASMGTGRENVVGTWACMGIRRTTQKGRDEIMTKDTILELIKDAMRARDKVRLSILRQLNEEFKKIEVDQRREVTEADVTACVKKLIKVTGETLDYSRQAATNQERTDALARQVEILQELLPHQVAGDELTALIDAVISEQGLSSKKDMGRLMKELGERTGGNFDKPQAAKLAGARLA